MAQNLLKLIFRAVFLYKHHRSYDSQGKAVLLGRYSADFHSALYTQLPLQALNHVLWNVGFIKLRTLH